MQDERKFLHDLAFPLSTALFIVDILVEDMQGEQPSSNNQVIHEQLQLVLKSLQNARQLLRERRKALIEREEKK